MSQLPPPATGTELYQAAILEELRAIRALLEGRSLARFVDERINEVLGDVADAIHYADGGPVPQAVDGPVDPPKQPTKRTRVRPPRTT